MTQRRKRGKKWISWVAFLVLLVAAVTVVYFVWDAYFKEKPVVEGDGPQPAVVVSKEENEKTEEKQEKNEPEKVVEKQETIQYEGEDPNVTDGLTGAVTYAGVIDDRLTIRVNIDQYVESGECKLALTTADGVVYNETVAMTDSAATSTCEGFDVTASNFASGRAEIVVILNSDGKSGEIYGEVSI